MIDELLKNVNEIANFLSSFVSRSLRQCIEFVRTCLEKDLARIVRIVEPSTNCTAIDGSKVLVLDTEWMALYALNATAITITEDRVEVVKELSTLEVVTELDPAVREQVSDDIMLSLETRILYDVVEEGNRETILIDGPLIDPPREQVVDIERIARFIGVNRVHEFRSKVFAEALSRGIEIVGIVKRISRNPFVVHPLVKNPDILSLLPIALRYLGIGTNEIFVLKPLECICRAHGVSKYYEDRNLKIVCMYVATRRRVLRIEFFSDGNRVDEEKALKFVRYVDPELGVPLPVLIVHNLCSRIKKSRNQLKKIVEGEILKTVLGLSDRNVSQCD